MRHTTYVVNKQVGLPDYRHENRFFIRNTRRRNIHEDTRRNGRIIEEHYAYKDKLILIKSIYGLVKASHFWFTDYINTMTLKAVFKKYNTDPCVFNRVDKLSTFIIIVNVDDTLVIGDKPSFVDKI